MSLLSPLPFGLSRLKHVVWPVALAVGVIGCSKPEELVSGSIGDPRKPAPVAWQPQLSVPIDGSRRLTDGEGEFVVANAIAAHEMRRP